MTGKLHDIATHYLDEVRRQFREYKRGRAHAARAGPELADLGQRSDKS
jgi:hypothetical protein